MPMSNAEDRIRRSIRDAQDMEAGRYTYRVHWSEKEGKFVGTCVGFPSLSYLASTRAEARTGIQDLVREVLERIRHSM
jgi:predicted RNase H-like HicB family nuclease